MAKKAGKKGGKRPGSGRPRVENAGIIVSARVPADVAKKLDRWTKREKMSRSAAVAEAVRRLVS